MKRPLDQHNGFEDDLLPEGWAWARIDEVCSKVQDGTHFPPKEQAHKGRFKYITAKNIKVWGLDLADVTYVSEQAHREIFARCDPEKGDVLYIKDGATTGIATVNPLAEEFSLLSSVALLKPHRHSLDSYFLKWYLNSPPGFRAMTDQMTGCAITRIILKAIRHSRVPVAPLAEQKRIVAKVEALLARVNAGRERLAKVPALLKRFRQAVLAAACSGQLTANWRKENPSIEPALILARRINDSRARNTAQASNGNRKAEASLVEVLAEGECPEDLIPEDWAWVRFGCIIGELRNGVSLRPNIEPPGTPILRISAARPGSVDLADIRYMPRGESYLPDYGLRDDDLLFTRYNGSIELLGVCGMVRGVKKNMLLYPDKLMRVRFDHRFVVPAYAEIYFQSPDVHERVVAKAKSSAGQNGVSGSDIKGQPFALAPLAEQREIVRRVEALFTLADKIEARVQAATARVEKITQAILAKAFRGELVPTEAELARQEGRDYEPASVLLERIRAARAANQTDHGKRPPRRRRHPR